MPFLFRRVRENFLLFILMGLLYFFVYKNVQMPKTPIAFPISCGGFLLITFFIYEYFLCTYLNNIVNANVYLATNLISYLLYMLLFYTVYFLGVFNILFFKSLYNIVFTPYSIFTFAGMSKGFSGIIIHLIFIIGIIITPYFVKDHTADPLGIYLTDENDKPL